MITNDLMSLVRANFAHTPTHEQVTVMDMWCRFLLARDMESIFLLRGYAGTGKTSLVGALVRTLEQLGQRFCLLAPTGRAAKVMASYSGFRASTIHRRIYRQKVFGQDIFDPVPNLHPDTLYIVDEASMISNDGLSGSIFGDGRLLDDLIQYVYGTEGCRLMLIGDNAQIPPVGESESPALSISNLSGYGLSVMHAELTEVVRQAGDSGILWNATCLRMNLCQGAVILPKMQLGYPDIKKVPGNELIESLEDSYGRCGQDGTIIITRSNKRANIYNQGVRSRILCYEEELTGGDMLMIAKNKYVMFDELSDGMNENKKEYLIANGEMAIVKRIHNFRELYGFRFADVTLRLLDHADGESDDELDTVVILDALHSDAPALTQSQQRTLFERVCEDYQEIHNKRELIKVVKNNPYYTALQVKYAYAVTCHKAQGGQWEDVYVDQGYMTDEMLGEDYLRWLYTAITRATGCVYLVNWPENQVIQAE